MKRVVMAIIAKSDKKEGLKYLLNVSHRDFGEFTGCYYPPGGHVEAGESDMQALQRELMEELELEVIAADEIAKTGSDIAGQETVWYKVEVKNFDLKVDESELKEANFFSQKEMQGLPLWPLTKKVFTKYIYE